MFTRRTPAAPAAPTISDQLRAALAETTRPGGGASFYAIGKAAGCDPSLVSRFAAGKRSLSLATASRIARALGMGLAPIGPAPAAAPPPPAPSREEAAGVV